MEITTQKKNFQEEKNQLQDTIKAKDAKIEYAVINEASSV